MLCHLLGEQKSDNRKKRQKERKKDRRKEKSWGDFFFVREISEVARPLGK